MRRRSYIFPFLRAVWPSLALLAFSGCGYTLSHRLYGPFVDPRGVFVPVFDNRTDETGAERVFTNALIREIQSRHQIRLSSREAGARELRGVIDTIEYNPTAYTAGGYNGLQSYRRLPTELGVRVTLTLSLRETKTNEIVWSKQFVGFLRADVPINRTWDFQSPSSLGIMQQSIVESTYEGVASNIMRDVYDELVELF